MGNDKLEKRLQYRQVEMKAMILYLAHPEMKVICLQTEKRMLMKLKGKHILPVAADCRRRFDHGQIIENIFALNLRFMFNVKNSVIMYSKHGSFCAGVFRFGAEQNLEGENRRNEGMKEFAENTRRCLRF